MKKGTKDFSQAASSHYKVITVEEKDELKERCTAESTKILSSKEIKQEGRSIFKSINSKVSHNVNTGALAQLRV